GGDVGGQRLTEHRAHLGAGEEIARLLGAQGVTGEEPAVGVVERQIHESLERHRSVGLDDLEYPLPHAPMVAWLAHRSNGERDASVSTWESRPPLTASHHKNVVFGTTFH